MRVECKNLNVYYKNPFYDPGAKNLGILCELCKNVVQNFHWSVQIMKKNKNSKKCWGQFLDAM